MGRGLSRLQALAPETDARSLIVAFGRACAARPNSCVLLAPRTAALMCSSHRKALPPGGHFLRRFTARKRNCLRAAAPSEQQIKRSAHTQWPIFSLAGSSSSSRGVGQQQLKFHNRPGHSIRPHSALLGSTPRPRTQLGVAAV
jgi:hypothetical protein